MILQFLRFLRFYNFKSISYTTLRFTPKWFSDSTDSTIVGRQIFIMLFEKKKRSVNSMISEMHPECVIASWDVLIFLLDAENIEWRVQLDAEKKSNVYANY